MPFSAGVPTKADRLPPANLEAERSVLGCCLLDNAMVDEVSAWVSDTDFYRATHAEIWLAVVAIRDEGKPVDAITLADYLVAKGRFQALGGNDMLGELIASVPHELNAVYYAKIIRELSVARQILEASVETIDEIYSGEFTAPDLIDRVEGRIFRITDRAAVGMTISAEGLAHETWERLLLLKERRVVGIPTGFGDLDDVVGGFRPGQLVILAARPAVGKTAIALNIASSLAAEGHGILFISLEMSRGELGNRLVSSFGNIDGGALLRPWFLGEGDWAKVWNACDQVSKFPLWIDDTPFRTASQIAANARRIKHRSPNGLGLVVIDYLSLINGQKQRGESRQEEVARISRRLKAMARDLRVPVLCLHQLHRQLESRDDHRPRMSDLRESGQIEQDADLILLLHRPDQFRADDRPNEADLIVAKNRNGAEGVVKLTFLKALTRFDSYAPASAGPDGKPF